MKLSIAGTVSMGSISAEMKLRVVSRNFSTSFLNATLLRAMSAWCRGRSFLSCLRLLRAASLSTNACWYASIRLRRSVRVLALSSLISESICARKASGTRVAKVWATPFLDALSAPGIHTKRYRNGSAISLRYPPICGRARSEQRGGKMPREPFRASVKIKSTSGQQLKGQRGSRPGRSLRSVGSPAGLAEKVFLATG